MDAGDLEGIAVISDSVLCVLAERAGVVIFLTHQGQEVERRKLEHSMGDNTGYEGLAYDRVHQRFFLAKEKNPRLLVELDGDLRVTSTVELEHGLDLSNLDYDHETGTLWLASHESRLIASVTTQGEIQGHLTVPFPQVEGIAYDSKKQVIYLVCDKREKLFVLKLQRKE